MNDKRKMFSDTTVNYALYQIIAWSALIIISILWNNYYSYRNNLEKARIEARTLYELTLAFRGWGALHGGVYVPVTDTFQPNRYITTPERDVTTKTGKKLTLINPAWMTRQVFELLKRQSELPIINHMTSLNYINPANKPEEWEQKGLRAFEQGNTEVSELVRIGDQPYLGLMKPFVTQQECLKCHGQQGYKVGDIRGGISIAVPMKPYLATEKVEKNAMLITHAVLWIIGIGGIIVFTRRIQRKQGEVFASEEKYRLLFEYNPHPMWVYDLESFAFLMVNAAAVREYGYSQEEFLSMTIKDIRPSEDVSAPLRNIANVTEGVGPAGEWRHRKKDGTIIYVEITSHTLEFAGRHAELVMTNDVTERRKLEDQLRHAQKMEAVGRLAGGVAHDFNNVLTAIIGYGSLLQMKMKADDPVRRNVVEILAAAQRGANLTQSLLAFSRKQINNPRRVDINQVVERVTKLLVRVIGEDVHVETKLDDTDLVVIADSGQLEQVLMNLATNARDSMPKGGSLHIEIKRVVLDERFLLAHNYGKPGAYALISITDSGTGMDAKTAGMIFEPFFTTKEVGRGTGLGLSMAYGIIKQHSGYITVYSEPGKGTTFKIYLPLAATASEEEKPEPAAVPIKGGGETVLLAEDDEPLRRLAKSVLAEFGYTVIEAVDGEDALEKIKQHRDTIQLLLVDVIMPKINGREVYAEAKKLMPSVKVLFMSGYTADILRKRGILDEGQGFIPKPVSPSDLLKEVRNVLDRET